MINANVAPHVMSLITGSSTHCKWNQYFAAVIDHTRFLSLPQVEYMKATTPRVNSGMVRWYPNKNTCPRSARSFRLITVKNLMWRHGTHFAIRLRSRSFRSNNYVLCSALHTSCQLPLLQLFMHAVLLILVFDIDSCHHRLYMTHALVHCCPEFKI